MSEPVSRKHDGSSASLFLFETTCVLIAYALVITHGYRILSSGGWTWSWLLAIMLAWVVADLVSGFVHWLADTWGSETMPWIGPRFLKPFRVHHVTPTSFVECSFMDTNGDTALIAIPFLLGVFAIPLSSPMGLWWAVFGASFCLFALPTNQIHQWAHREDPPRLVRILQRYGLILSPSHHQRHHSGSHDGYYCISSGFCNYWLERVGFFRYMEHLVTALTRIRPRAEESVRHDDRQTS